MVIFAKKTYYTHAWYILGINKTQKESTSLLQLLNMNYNGTSYSCETNEIGIATIEQKTEAFRSDSGSVFEIRLVLLTCM